MQYGDNKSMHDELDEVYVTSYAHYIIHNITKLSGHIASPIGGNARLCKIQGACLRSASSVAMTMVAVSLKKNRGRPSTSVRTTETFSGGSKTLASEIVTLRHNVSPELNP